MSSELYVSQHLPVLLDEALRLFEQTDPTGKSFKGIFVDGTVGGGGHAAAILERLSPAGQLCCFDRDPDAITKAKATLRDDSRAAFYQESYSEVGKYLAPESAQGILLDLGLSSDQLEAKRGFSYSHESLLDMRFDPSIDINAYDVVNGYPVAKLRQIFFKYGEEPFAPRIARGIAEIRKSGAIRTTAQLANVIRESVPRRFQVKAVTRIFQAIRIEVNREIELLEQGLPACWDVLEPGGILCVISYHSIEDRRMKRFLAGKVKGCTCPPKLPLCVCGIKPSAKVLTSSAVRPSPKEIRLNPRSRSARLRAAKKIRSDEGGTGKSQGNESASSS